MKLNSKLAMLIALAIAIDAWVIVRTVVIARDGPRFIRMAQFLPYDFEYALTSEFQHPMYPACVLGMHTVLSPVLGSGAPQGWALSAQLTSATFGILSLVLVFLMCREIFDERVACIAALLFVLLPEKAKIGANALSDMTHLFWSLVALWSGYRGITRRQMRWIVAGALATAVAYLTRPEGLGCALVILCGLVFLRRFADPPSWRWRAAAGAVLVGVVAAGVLPYVVLQGKLFPKLNVTRPGQHWFPASSRPGDVPTREPIPYPRLDDVKQGLVRAAQPDRSGPASGPLLACSALDSLPRLLAVEFPWHWDWRRIRQQLHEALGDLVRMLHGLLVPFFVIGLGASLLGATRLARPKRPAATFYGLYMVLQTLLCLLLAVVGTDISKRHILPLATFCTFYSAAGLAEVVAWWPQRRGFRDALSWNKAKPRRTPSEPRSWPSLRMWAVWLAPFGIASLAEISVPICNKKEHKAVAAEFVRSHSQPGDRVASTSLWIGFYADRPFILISGPGQTMDNDVLAPFLLRCQTNWLAVLVRYDEDGFDLDEYQRMLRGRPRLVRNVPSESLTLEKRVPSVRIPRFLARASEQSELVELIPKFLGPRLDLKALRDKDQAVDASGRALTDALLRAIREPGTQGLLTAPKERTIRKLVRRAKRHLAGDPISSAALADGRTRLEQGAMFRLAFENGSVLDIGVPDRDYVARRAGELDRIWVDDALTLSRDAWETVRRTARPRGHIRLYMEPERAVFVYRVHLPALRIAWESRRQARRERTKDEG